MSNPEPVEPGENVLEEIEHMQKPFSVVSITKQDVFQLGATDEQLALLTDDDMAAIASYAGSEYIVGRFWDDLRAAVNHRLQVKGQPELLPDETNEPHGR